MKLCVGVLCKIAQAVLRFFNIGLFYVPNTNRIKVRHEDLSVLGCYFHLNPVTVQFDCMPLKTKASGFKPSVIILPVDMA